MSFEYDADPEKVLNTAISLSNKQMLRLQKSQRSVAKHRLTPVEFYQTPYETLISQRIAALLIGYAALTKNPAGMNAPYKQS